MNFGETQTFRPEHPLTITLSDLLGDFVLPVPATLGSAGLDFLVHKGACSFHGDHINYILQLPRGHSELLICVQGAAGRMRNYCGVRGN